MRRRALVTGASGAIGAAICRRLAADGCEVIAHAHRNIDAARSVAEEIGGRAIAFRRRSKGVIWFDFAELFEKPRSQVDFLEIASAYHTVLISGVHRMAPAQSDVIRRFTWLVDIFYDQRVKLVLSAQAEPEALVGEADEKDAAARMVHKEFARTASRLREMQSKDYFARKHASAENPRVMEKQ